VLDALRQGHVLCRPELLVSQSLSDFRIEPETRLVLTEAGAARALQGLAAHRGGHDSADGEVAKKRRGRSKPHWDCHARNLYYGETLILHFHRDAPNQMRILDAFEELRWTPRTDDPLPPHGGVDPRERLHDAVKNLNLRQSPLRLSFVMEADGRGVRWLVIEP